MDFFKFLVPYIVYCFVCFLRRNNINIKIFLNSFLLFPFSYIINKFRFTSNLLHLRNVVAQFNKFDVKFLKRSSVFRQAAIEKAKLAKRIRMFCKQKYSGCYLLDSLKMCSSINIPSKCDTRIKRLI